MMLHVDQKEFLMKCLDVLDKYGHDETNVFILGTTHDAIVYEDNLILINKSKDDKWMEMVRKYNDNAFYYYQDGSTIRFNSDFIYLDDHINKLLEK